MFKKRETRLEIEIDRIHDALDSADPETDPKKYKALVKLLQELKRAQSEDKKYRVSPDTILTIAAYVGVTALVAVLEIFGHAITTKALSFKPFGAKI